MQTKEFRFREFKADTQARTFRGYASTWDRDVRGDIIQRGAFAKTITERGPRKVGDANRSDIKILWQHEWTEPIGLPTLMQEDEKGLYVEGSVIATDTGVKALTLMDAGIIDRMSIGFTVIRAETRYSENGDYEGRNLLELKLYEFSPVTFPANEAAIIMGTKDALRGLSVDDLLEVLSEIMGEEQRLTATGKIEAKSLQERLKARLNEPTIMRLHEALGALVKPAPATSPTSEPLKTGGDPHSQSLLKALQGFKLTG